MANLKILHLTLFLLILSVFPQTKAHVNSRKLDDQSPPNIENKCGNCPCNTPCDQPPPPPIPSQPPPPPSPKKKPPPGNNCPPPPGGQYPPFPPYIYMNGPPGNLYPVDQFRSGSTRISYSGNFPFLIIIWAAVISLLNNN